MPRGKALTPNQRRAIARRAEQHELRKQLESLRDRLERHVPEGRRSQALNALCCILDNGWLFTMACGKAAVLRGGPEHWGCTPDDLWPFVDRCNAEFAARMLPEIVETWNTPAYPELAQADRAEAQ